MNPVEVFSGPLVHHFVHALLHTLWQGVAVMVTVGLMLSLLPARCCVARYRLALAAQLAIPVAGMLTWSILHHRAHAVAPIDTVAVAQEPADFAAGGPAIVEGDRLSEPVAPREQSPGARSAAAPQVTGNWVPWAVTGWLAGVLIMLVRTASSVSQVCRLARGPKVTDEAITKWIDSLRIELNIRRPVQSVLVDKLCSPAVMGIVRPTVLIPASLISGVPPATLQVILAHELAHIRRCDYLVNLVQMIVESLLFFNPAIWWLGHRVRAEREACTDALAAVAVGGEVHYSRTLAEWAGRSRQDDQVGAAAPVGGQFHAPTVAPAWAGRSRQRPLADRIRRLLIPEHRPEIPISWSGLLGAFFLACLILPAIWRGSVTVVALAAEVLSPAERIEQLEKLARSHGEAPTAVTPQGRFTLSGRVRMADSSPLPEEKFFVGGSLMRRGYVGTVGLNIDGEGRFEQEIGTGTLYLHTQPSSYAVSIVGPIEARAGERLDDIELVISRGFTSTLRFVNERGEPVPGVQIEAAHYRFSAGNGSSGRNHPAHGTGLRSDARGEIKLQHCTAFPLQIDVRAAGYQFDRKQLTLMPEQAQTWTLADARPTSGTIRGADGSPAAGAEIHLAVRDGAFPLSGDPREGSDKLLLTTGDDEGRFVLDTLRDDCRYVLFVKAKGHGVRLLGDVTPGQSELNVVLGPELTVRGRLRGGLDRLPHWPGEPKPHIKYRNDIELQPNARYSGLLRTPVDVVEDDLGTFVIEDIFPGRVDIGLPGQTVRLNVSEPIDDLEIDLSRPAEQPADAPAASRKVRFRFELPDDAPPPQGKLKVGYSSEFVGPARFRQWHLDADTDTLELDLPAGGRLQYSGEELIGYWIEFDSVEVPSADEPLEIVIAAHPAGAIFGRLLAADGSPAGGTIYLIAVAPPEYLPEAARRRSNQSSVNRSDGRFALSPLPLSGQYRLLARESDTQARVLSDVITLDEVQPLHEAELRFPEGIDFRVRVVDAEGKAVIGTKVELEYVSPHSTSYGGDAATTDAEGVAIFERLNPELPGRYSVSVRPYDRYQGRYLRIDDPSVPPVLQLDSGVTLSGVIVDGETGQRLPDTALTLWPEDLRGFSGYPGPVETVSDADGRFEFRNLAPTLYRTNVAGHPVVKVTPNIDEVGAGGRPLVRGGDPRPVTVSVETDASAGGGLRP